MEQGKSNTKVGGIDVSKAKLDVAVHGQEEVAEVGNGPDGFAALGRWLTDRGVSRVGLEATGGYERAVVAWLRVNGFEVVIHQPLEVRLFARLKRKRAKNDRIDAQLIAAATAQVEAVKAACDPLLVELAERMTAYEQAADQLARLKGCLEQVTLKDLQRGYERQIQVLTAWKRRLILDLVKRIKARPDLARRYALLLSLPGVGPVVATSLIVRMPELGALSSAQAASLAGLAPFDFDTGQYKGQRHICGGRGRLRRMLYLAALAAKRHDPALHAFAQRLLDSGKPAKVTITAVMRKLIEAANLVLARQTPWQPSTTR